LEESVDDFDLSRGQISCEIAFIIFADCEKDGNSSTNDFSFNCIGKWSMESLHLQYMSNSIDGMLGFLMEIE
jgi:hypothetical protein